MQSQRSTRKSYNEAGAWEKRTMIKEGGVYYMNKLYHLRSERRTQRKRRRNKIRKEEGEKYDE